MFLLAVSAPKGPLPVVDVREGSGSPCLESGEPELGIGQNEGEKMKKILPKKSISTSHIRFLP